VLADAEVKVSAAIVIGLEITGAWESKPRFRRRREIGSTAEKPRQARRDRVQNPGRGVATGDPVRIGGEDRDVLVPPLGEVAPLHALARVGQLGVGDPIALEQCQPLRPELRSASPEFRREVLVHTIRHQKFRVLWPAIGAFREPDLLLTQGFAVRARGILLMRRTIADMALDDDQARPIVNALGDRDRVGDPLTIVGVADPLHVPAIVEKTPGDVLAEGECGVPLDRDVVAVVDPAEIAESNSVNPGLLKCRASQLAAIAMPTLVAIPWPNGPVVVSIPEVKWYSG